MVRYAHDVDSSRGTGTRRSQLTK